MPGSSFINLGSKQKGLWRYTVILSASMFYIIRTRKGSILYIISLDIIIKIFNPVYKTVVVPKKVSVL